MAAAVGMQGEVTEAVIISIPTFCCLQRERESMCGCILGAMMLILVNQKSILQDKDKDKRTRVSQ